MWPRRYGRREGGRAAVAPRRSRWSGGSVTGKAIRQQVADRGTGPTRHAGDPLDGGVVAGRLRRFGAVMHPDRGPPRAGGGRIGVVKRSAVRTGRLRRSPAVHSRPIDLVVFQEPS